MHFIEMIISANPHVQIIVYKYHLIKLHNILSLRWKTSRLMEFLLALEDVFWIITHPYDIIYDFFIKNSICAIRFIRNPPGEAPGEVDLLYPRNWLSILHLAFM